MASPQPAGSEDVVVPPRGPATVDHEVRFAVVMYGGVSLAVYIYGVARELFELVRATAATEDGEFVFADVEGTAAVYRELARTFGTPGDSTVPEGAPLGCRFVVDIVSGTSAGGLNGVCLAAALAGDREGGPDNPLAALESLWVHEGDIGRLVADERSTWTYDADDNPLGPDDRFEVQPGASLLNGRRFYFALADTLTTMLEQATADGSSRLVEELDLWVTATDLDGRRIDIPLENETISEADHHVRFHFRYDRDAGPSAFTAELASFLAFAGRATSSFPAAFAPVRLDEFDDRGGRWKGYFPGYAQEERPHDRRTLSDGGILDNKPFTGATASLVERRSAVAASRKLLYVEPDPGGLPVPRDTWTVPQTAQAALSGIPRSETINADITGLLERNLEIERAREIVALSGVDVHQRDVLTELSRKKLDLGAWRSASLSEAIALQPLYGPTYAAYHRLKVRGVVDLLASLLATGAGYPGDGIESEALRYVVRAWKGSRYAEEPIEPARSENEFLFRFDVPYRIRRLAFLLDRVRCLEHGDAGQVAQLVATAGMLELPAPESELGRYETLAEIRIRLTRALAVLVAARRDPGPAAGLWCAGAGDRDALLAILADPDDGRRLRAAEVFLQTREDVVSGALEFVYESISGSAKRASERVSDAVGVSVPDDADGVHEAMTEFPAAVRYVLRFHFDTFELFDLIYLPLSFGTDLAETNPVDVYRVSPESSSPSGGVRPVLLGTCAGHFGAFFDPAWRRHDMAWGRINAAEQIIRATLGGDDPRAEALIARAQAKVTDAYVQAAPTADRDPTRLGGVAVPGAPAADALNETVRRAGVAASDVVIGLAGDSALGARIAAAARAGFLTPGGALAAGTAVVTAATPRKILSLALGLLAATTLLALACIVVAFASQSRPAFGLALVLVALAAAAIGGVAVALGVAGYLSIRARRLVHDGIVEQIRAPQSDPPGGSAPDAAAPASNGPDGGQPIAASANSSGRAAGRRRGSTRSGSVSSRG